MSRLLHLFMFVNLLISSLANTGCSTEEPENHAGDPVDGPYTVALSRLRMTCYDSQKGLDSTPIVDKRYPATSFKWTHSCAPTASSTSSTLASVFLTFAPKKVRVRLPASIVPVGK